MTLDKESNWAKNRFEKIIHPSNEDKIAISNYYQAALKTGRSSDEVLEELEVKYGKSTRQIQRYIRDIEAKRTEQAIHAADRANQLEQMRHITDLQGIVRNFLHSVQEITTDLNFNDISQSNEARTLLWQAFKELTGNALWESLSEHLGAYGDCLVDMLYELEPEETENRDPTKSQVLGTGSEDDSKVIEQALELISGGDFYVIVEASDTKYWALNGFQPICQWCPIQK